MKFKGLGGFSHSKSLKSNLVATSIPEESAVESTESSVCSSLQALHDPTSVAGTAGWLSLDAVESKPSPNRPVESQPTMMKSSRSSSSSRPHDSKSSKSSRLEIKLKDAQRVVRAVLGVDHQHKVDSSDALRAIRQFALMQKELKTLNKELSMAQQQKSELEDQWTSICMERNQTSMQLTSLRTKLEQQERQLQKLQQNSSSSTDSHTVSQALVPANPAAEPTNERLERQLEELQALLEQRQDEMMRLQAQLADSKKTKLSNNAGLEGELQQAKEEIEELENERQLNMAEIVDLSKQLRRLQQQQQQNSSPALPTEDASRVQQLLQTNQERQTRIVFLQDQQTVYITKLEELSRQLQEANATIQALQEDRQDTSNEQQEELSDLQKRLAESELAQERLQRMLEDTEGQLLQGDTQVQQAQQQETLAQETLKRTQAQLEERTRELEAAQAHARDLESQLHDSFQQLQDQEQQHQDDLVQVQEELQTAHDEIAVLEGLEETVNDLYLQLEESQATCHQHKTTIQEQATRLQQAESQVALSQSKLEELTAQCTEARATIQDRDETIDTLNRQLDETRDEISRLQELEQELDHLHQQIEENQAVEQDQLAEIESLRLELESERDRIAAFENHSKFIELQEENRILASRLEESNLDLQDQNLLLQDLQDELALLEEQLQQVSASEVGKQLLQNIRSNPSATLEFTRGVAALEADLLTTQSALAKEQELSKTLQEQVSQLQSTVDESITNMEQLENDRNFNIAKVVELKEFVEARGEPSEVEKKLYEKGIECAELSAKVSSLVNKLDKYQKNIGNLQDECESKHQQLNELSEASDRYDKMETTYKAMETKLGQVVEMLNASQERAEQLQKEREASVEKAAILSIELADSRAKIDELTEKLEHAVLNKSDSSLSDPANTCTETPATLTGYFSSLMMRRAPEVVSEDEEDHPLNMTQHPKKVQSMKLSLDLSQHPPPIPEDDDEKPTTTLDMSRHGVVDADSAAGCGADPTLELKQTIARLERENAAKAMQISRLLANSEEEKKETTVADITPLRLTNPMNSLHSELNELRRSLDV